MKIKKKERVEMFDYGNISNTQKEALEEAANVVGQSNPEIAALLRNKFYLKEPNKIPMEKSIFLQLAHEAKMNFSLQGYNISRDELGEETYYPIVSFCEDIRNLDNLLMFIMKKYGIESKKD